MEGSLVVIGQMQLLMNVILAGALGGAIGIERELAGKAAGLRTHILVAATAALLVGLGNALVEGYAGVNAPDIASDPLRIVQAIVIGIGFLGAGTIIHSPRGEHIEGLTTGASLLLAAALGIAVAAGAYWAAVGAGLAALGVLVLLGLLETHIAACRERRKGPRRHG